MNCLRDGVLLLMNVLVLSCSPRPGGNSDTLATEMIRGIEQGGGRVEKIMAARLRIKPCSQCDRCIREGVCQEGDDMDSLYPKIIDCDALVLAAPIYFMAHNAQAKLIIDRCQLFWAAKYQLMRPLIQPDRRRLGVFLATGATHGPNVFAGARVTMKWLFDALDMEYWNDILVEGVDEKGDILNQPWAIEKARKLGLELVEFLKV